MERPPPPLRAYFPPFSMLHLCFLSITNRRVLGKMPPKQRSVCKIDSADFQGSEELDASDWKKLVVSSLPTSVRDLFPDWTGEPLVIPGLILPNDNASVANQSVFFQGDMLEGKKKAVLASRFWPMSDNAIYLAFPSLPGNLFKFGSSLVDSSRIKFESSAARCSLPSRRAATTKLPSR